MSADHLIREKAGASSVVQPFLHALNRMQQRETLRPEQLTERAQALLRERFGRSAGAVEAAFAHGSVGLMGAHTHYFNGFAFMMTLAHGTAVAARVAEGAVSRVVFDGQPEVDVPGGEAAGAEGGPAADALRMVEALVERMVPERRSVELGIVSTMRPSCPDAYLSALGVAVGRAFQALFALPHDAASLVEVVHASIAEETGLPFSLAYPLAAEAGRPEVYTLVDTETCEQLPLPSPSPDLLGWGLVDLGGGLAREPAFYVRRNVQAREALVHLQRHGFDRLASFRDLEHRDLQRALEAAPRRYRPVVRHLVTENRRVQKLGVAVRRRDWQMFGALLLMSHASQRNDWQSTSPEADCVVEEVEAMSLEGMYGARLTGRGGCVLVVGQPFVVPQCLDRIKAAFETRFGRVPDAVLL